MFSLKLAGLIVIGGLTVGCQSHGTPQASAPVEPMGEQSSMQIEQSWRAANPGSRVGHVNAVLPGRRMLSVANLPLDHVHRGDVVTVLLDPRGTSTVEAVVVAKHDGYLQLSYQPLHASQRDPAMGDLAVWYPGGAAVPTTALHPAAPQMTSPPANEAAGNAPATQPAPEPSPAANTPAPPPSSPPANPTPPATNTPSPAENTAPATTQPSAGSSNRTQGAAAAAQTGAPTTTQPADFNK